MKRNLLLLIVLCCTMTMLAQNGKISYQAVVRDSENHLVYDTPLQVTVSLANSETGTAVYSEQHAVTSNANGLISLLIGDGQNKQGHWEDVQWNTAWMTATIRKASDQTFLAEHHLPLSAVPYALYADFADSVNLAVLQDYLDEHHYVTEDELPAVQANADWTETNPDTASYIKNKPDLNDYEKKSELCGDVKDCIKDTLGKYTTSDQIDTLLGAYYDTTHTKSVISDTATALRAMMGDAANDGQLTIIAAGDTTRFTANQATNDTVRLNKFATKDTLAAYYDTADVKQMLKPYLKANELCDSIVKCEVVKNMRDSLHNAFDTLKYYTTSDQIDTLLGAYYDSTKVKSVISDTADAIRAAIPASQVNADWNATGGPAEILNKPDLSVYATTNALKDSLSRYVGKDKLNDTLDSYYTKNNIDSKLNDYEKKSELCGDVKDCIKDTLGKYTTSNQIDTLLGAYYDTTHTKSVISDTATALRNMMVDAANDGQLTIIAVGDTTRFTANQATNDTVRLNKFATKDTLNKYTTSDQIDTLLEAYATTEDLAYYERQDNLCRDVKDCIKDTLNHYTTSNQIDTLLRAYYDTTQVKSVISDTATALRNMMVDAANDGQLTIIAAGDTTRFTANQATNDTVRLNKFATKDTLNKYTTSDQIDTLLGAYAKTADLANYERQDNLCRDVKTCIKDTLSKYTTTNQLDTVIRKYDYATNTRVKNDSTWLQANIDTVSSHIRAIIPTVNDNAITIQVNGKDVGDFTLNQSSDETINVQHVVTDTAANTLTGKNTFTDTNYVQKRGFSFETPGKTTQESCQVMVNACDLLAIFDSLSRRIDTLQKNLNTLMNSVPPVFNSLTLSDTTATTMKVTADFSSPGTAITSYEFCYRRHDGVGGTQCVTSTTNEFVISGLQPYTKYDFSATATNIAGTTPSDVAIGQTLADEPSGDLNAETVNPRAFKVTVEHLDFGGAPSGNVKIYYKKKNDVTCSGDVSDYGTPLSFLVNLTSEDDSTFVRTIEDLDPSEIYCVLVELTNTDSAKVSNPVEVTSGGTMALEITSNANYGNLDVCEQSSVTAVYTATPTEHNPEEYTYQWEVVGTSLSQNTGNDNHVEFNHAVGHYTISCTATHPTAGVVANTYSITVTNSGHVPAFTLCSDSLRVNLGDISYVENINWGDSDNDESVTSESVSHLYGTSSVYTITAKNSSGCVAAKELPVGVSTMHPCVVSTKNDNEKGPEASAIDSLKDYDGNWYAVAQIGNQCWMKSNLRTTHFSDGTPITNGTGSGADNSLSQNIAYYYQPVASSSFSPSYDFSRYNVKTYGLYYNWKAAMNGAASSNAAPSGVQGVCPTGWHLPSEKEWDTLFAYAQTLPDVSTYNHQQIGYLHALSGGCEWEPCNFGCPGCPTPVRNCSEFTAIPAGEACGIFLYNKVSGNSPQEASFWSSTAVSPFAGSPQSRNYIFFDGSRNIRKTESYTIYGFSVRCVRDYENATPTIKPTVTTEDATNVGIDTAKLNGSITIPDGVTIMAKGFKFKEASASEYNTEYLTGDELVYVVKGLTAGTEYTYRAFAIYDNGTEFGVEKSFTTQREPSVSTGDTSNVGMSSATLHGTVTNPDDATITAMGFEYKLSDATSYTSVSGSLDDNALSANLEGLQPGQTYTYKAFITYNGQTVYGHDSTFKTKAVPTVTTSNVGFVGEKTAILNGTITNPDHVLITAKGFQWKLSSATGYTTTVPVDGDELVYDLSGLDPGTEYTYRTYITYVGETHYSTNEVSFTTKTEPTVYTETPININFTSATLKGTFSNVSSLNIEPVGFEWKETAAENFTNEVTSVTVTGDETAYVMSYDLSGLTAGKSYDYRAFITHAGVREYQNVVTFSTWTPPTVLTNSASGISTNTVTLNGTVNNPSGVSITAQGFEYKAEGESSYTTIPGTVTGNAFSASVTNLTPDKTYSFRAFITYAGTTVYGNENDSTFTTKVEPTVVTNDETEVGETTATLNGTVNNPGEVVVTKGFAWKKSSDSEYDTVYVTNEPFTYSLTGLTGNTEYTFNAFVVFDGKTVSDADSAFTTLPPTPKLFIESDAPSNPSVCSNGSVAFTYTATVEVGGTPQDVDDYTYSWEVPSGLEYTTNDNTCTVIYAASGTYTVSCTATPEGDGEALPQATKEETLGANQDEAPSFIIAGSDFLFVKVKSISNAISLNWGNNTDSAIVNNPPETSSYTYSSSGVYIITATRNNGCTKHERVAVGHATLHPCTVASKNSHEGGSSNTSIDSLQDVDGNWYGVVQIGSQCWMKSNLRTTRYSDGVSVGTLGTSSNGNTTSATVAYYYKPTSQYQCYNNTYIFSHYNEETYGLYYNWLSATRGVASDDNPSNVQGACPTGWHIPSRLEWTDLITYIKSRPGASENKYAQLLSSSCQWTEKVDNYYPGSTSQQNRDSIGFSAVPAGHAGSKFDYNMSAGSEHQIAEFWSSTEGPIVSGTRASYSYYLQDNKTYLTEENDRFYFGHSVRCVRNTQPVLEITSDNNNPKYCPNADVTVTYTAVAKKGTESLDGYSYSWAVPTGLVYSSVDNVCTVTYSSAATYTITCTAHSTDGDIENTISQSVSAFPALSFTFCDDEKIVTLKSLSNVNSIAWGDGNSSTSGLEVGATHTYSSSGAYTMTATSSDGCTLSKPVAIEGATVFPCTAPSTHAAQTDITGGGYNGEPDGKEVVDGEGKIISVTDYDGNVYPVVQIGSQCWLAENMRCTHSPSGQHLYIVNPQHKGVNVNQSAISCSSKAAQWYMNDSTTYAPMRYGLLYNWCAAVDTFYAEGNISELATTNQADGFNCVFSGYRRGICPKGWHVPTNQEWLVMETYVNGGSEPTSGSLWRGYFAGRLTSSCDWNDANCESYYIRPGNYKYQERNKFGFCALPASYFINNNTSSFATQIGYDARFWTSSQENTDSAYDREFDWNKEGVMNVGHSKSFGNSVRCVRDAE